MERLLVETDLRTLVPIFVGIGVVAGPALTAWSLYRRGRAKAEIREALAQDGYRTREIEFRWLTRGPFKDMRLPGTKHSPEQLLRIVVEDDQGARRVGWVRWRARAPWRAANRWSLLWDDDPNAEPRGLSSAAFTGVVFAATAAVLTFVVAMWLQTC